MDENQFLNALSKMMDDKLGSALKPIHERLDKIEEDTRQTRVLVENQEHGIRLIAEQYTDIAKQFAPASEVHELRDRVRTLERVVTSHTDQINDLKKAQ